MPPPHKMSLYLPLLILVLLLKAPECVPSSLTFVGDNPRCVANAKGNTEPKYFYYGDIALNIKILTSSRLTHKLVSTILAVFTEEVLGYANVTLVEIGDPRLGFEPDAQFANISSCEKNE